MNILLVTYEWPPQGCGIGTHMFNLARGLNTIGHKVYVITHDNNPVELDGVRILPVANQRNNTSVVSKLRKRKDRIFHGIVHPWSWKAFEEYEKLVNDIQLDIIETAEFGAWCWHFLDRVSIPITVRCHNPAHVVWAMNSKCTITKDMGKQDFYEKELAKRADGLCSPSHSLANHLFIQWCIPRDKFTVIPNPIDADLFKPNNRGKNNKEILFVGRLEHGKGVFHLAKAISRILPTNRDIHARFIGMNRPVDWLGEKKLASDIILSLIQPEFHEQIHFVNHIPVSEVVEYQNRALISVVPTIGFENFPYTVMEAMACGTPVIATHCGGQSEIIENNVDGLLVPPGDIEFMANGLQKLINDSQLRENMSIKARSKIEDYYSIQAIVPRIVDWYGEVISNYRNAQR